MSRRLQVPTQRRAPQAVAGSEDPAAVVVAPIAPVVKAGPWRIAVARQHVGLIPLPCWGGHLSLCEAAPEGPQCTLPVDQQVTSIRWRSTPAGVVTELEAIALELDAAAVAGADPAAGRWWRWIWQLVAGVAGAVQVVLAAVLIARLVEAVTR